MGIPRTFHYIWFGGAPKPQLVLACIDSWRRLMPDWQIREWNESNYDVTKAAYPREAHEARKWAFASDYARFDILRQYGGVYLDTDVELLKAIPDWILEGGAFTGMDSGGIVNPGQIFGCEPSLPLLTEVLESYEDTHFVVDGRMNTLTVNYRITQILERHGLGRTDDLQRVAGLTVYPSTYFCGYDMDTHEPNVTELTVSVHHCAHSWGSPRELFQRRTQLALRHLIGTSRYRKLLALKRSLLGVRGMQPRSVPSKRRSGRA